MPTTEIRISSRFKGDVLAVINKLMDKRLAFSVFTDPTGDGWLIVGRVEELEEREKQELAQSILGAYLGIPRLV